MCVISEPDRGHVLGLADVELLPGECAAAGDGGRGGLVRVETRDPQRRERSRWLSTRRGATTVIEVQSNGKPVRAQRQACGDP